MTIAVVDVLSVLLLAALALLLVSIAVSIVLARRRRPPVADAAPPAVDDRTEIEAHRRLVDERGSELIERRVELDARRGTLGSYGDVNDAFTLLEQRRSSGEMTDEEFEKEKIRLLTEGHS